MGNAKWTTKLQTEIIVQDVNVALSNSHISGLTLWHFFDFKVDDKHCGQCEYEKGVLPPICGWIDTSCARPGGENHKGVVDAWRRPKESYPIVGQMFNASQNAYLRL